MSISIRSIVKESWTLFKKYWKQVYVVLILAILVNVLGSVFQYDAGGDYTVSSETAAQYEAGEISLAEVRIKADVYDDEKVGSAIGAALEALEAGDEITAENVLAEVESDDVTVTVPESGNLVLAIISFVLSIILSFVLGVYAILFYLSAIRGSATPLKDAKNNLAIKDIAYFVVTSLAVAAISILLVLIFMALGFALLALVGGLVGPILFGVFLIIGFVVCIYISIRLYFAVIISVDEKVWAVSAIKSSWEMTKGEVITIIKLGVMTILLIIAGTLALAVGLLIAIPVSSLMIYVLYSKLKQRTDVTPGNVTV